MGRETETERHETEREEEEKKTKKKKEENIQTAITEKKKKKTRKKDAEENNNCKPYDVDQTNNIICMDAGGGRGRGNGGGGGGEKDLGGKGALRTAHSTCKASEKYIQSTKISTNFP